MTISGCIVMNRPHRDNGMMNQSVRCDGAISGHHEKVMQKQKDKPDESSLYVHGPPSGGHTYFYKANQLQETSMTRLITSDKQLSGTVIHRCFMPFVSVDHIGVQTFLKSIATNAVGKVITLEAMGIRPLAMVMPNMSIEPRCQVKLPKNAWLNNMAWMQNKKLRQGRYLEVICWQISGAVAESALDQFDHYGDLGLGDIEDSFEFLAAYESAHNVPSDWTLAGCVLVIERLLGKYYDIAEAMAEHLFQQGGLTTHELNRYLSCIGKEELGNQVLAVLQEPWIEESAERVHRQFIGS